MEARKPRAVTEHSVVSAWLTVVCSFGAKPFIFHRAQLIQVLYDGLPKEARDKVLTGKRVLDIASVDKDAVSVSCDDGSVFQGSMVIGADGVHSKTRQMMRKAAMQADPEADCDDEEPFTSTYRCLWSSFARPASSDMGWNIDTQDSSRSVMYLTGRDKAWIFLYERLPEPTNDRATYTAEDISDFAAQFADYHITEKLKVGDVFDATTAGMSNLDEGIVRKWSHGRIVLVGDACHKFTPNAGLGLNSGIQDVVAVCNRITRLVRASPGGIPDTTSLTSIFDDYRVARQSLLQADYSRSAAMTRMHAWANVWYRLVSRYVMASSFVEILLLKYIVPSQLRQALVLDYVPAEEPFSGSVSWLHPMKPNIDDDVIIGTNKCDSSSSMQESLFNS